MQELYHKLLKDLKSVGISVEFELEIRAYSKTYFGRYDPNTNKVTVYVFQDPDCTNMYKYEDLLFTLVHEAVHCIQWQDDSYVRQKGIMHDTDFYKLYNMYSDRVKAQLLLREVRYDTFFTVFRGKTLTVCCQYG